MTTFNRWASATATLSSLVTTKNSFIEIIVIDDCSDSAPPKDFTDLVKQNSVKFIRHRKNMGLPAARNSAIQLANGKYFSFCDDDDIWHPRAVELILTSIEKYNPDMLIAQSKDVISRIHSNPSKNLKDLFFLGVTPPVGSQVYLLSLIKSVGGYCEYITSGVDHDLWVRLVSNKNINVRIISGSIAIPNKNNNLDRMTLNVDRRVKGISHSLEIWRDDLVKTFGINFFKHFKNEYQYHIKKKFLLSAIQRNDISYLLADIKYLVLEFRLFYHFLEFLHLKKKVSSFRPYKGERND